MSKRTEKMTGLNTWHIAFRNMQYHKSKNILTGIAIFITTILLFVIPTVGKDLMDSQYAMVNKVYPTWHALYRNVSEKTVKELSVHHDIAVYGLRSDPGFLMEDGITGVMMYLDETAATLMKGELISGRLPEAENEIVVSHGMLQALDESGDIGDKVALSYQIERNGGLDLAEKKEFIICGFIADAEESIAKKQFTTFVSKEFLKAEVPADQIVYRFMFQLFGIDDSNTVEIEEKVKELAKTFDITEKDTNINKEYLAANYVDPVMVPVIVGIMVIIVLAGIITIYSICFVSMAQRVQEFGRLKAIGATKRQIRQIVLREGMSVAAIVIPFGLLCGTFISRMVLLKAVTMAGERGQVAEVIREIIINNEIHLYHFWIYLLAVAVTLITVYLSLMQPMRRASGISEIEAMRYQGESGHGKSFRKGYEYLTISRLTGNNIWGNKKKSMITILSMGATGIFLMVIATVLSCADPVESANSSIVGQYEIIQNIDDNNKEHPERAWSEIQKNNLLNEELKAKIEGLDKVQRVDIFSQVEVSGGPFDEEIGGEDIYGVPKEYAGEIEKGIIEGKATYEDLCSGDKVVADQTILYWYPEIKVGDRLTITIHDGENSYEKDLEIAAIGDYRSGLTEYHFLLMAKEAADSLCSNNNNYSFQVMADSSYDESLAKELAALIENTDVLGMRTWKSEYETMKSGIAMIQGACYAFFGMIGVICIMNLINTMINSVHVRKKELGMMQAIGMSNRQLGKMLQLEGLFYTVGTLVLSIGAGSLLGYPLYLWAKKEKMFNISEYHYPVTIALVITVVLLVIQIVLAFFLGKSVKKESLIERIRFSE